MNLCLRYCTHPPPQALKQTTNWNIENILQMLNRLTSQIKEDSLASSAPRLRLQISMWTVDEVFSLKKKSRVIHSFKKRKKSVE